MTELSFEKITAVLEQAHRIDPKCELFGASKHQYKLNPPLRKAAVREVEETYGFRLPEDYVHFITEVANGGAGPDYGIMSFENSLMTGPNHNFQEAYQSGLKKPFVLRLMRPEEVENYAFAETSYEQDPGKFFVCETAEVDRCDGFLVLGTHGCQWDFGLVVSGERKGQVFDTDNEGGYAFVAPGFHTFYQTWLDWLSDPDNIQRELEKWRKLREKRDKARWEHKSELRDNESKCPAIPS